MKSPSPSPNTNFSWSLFTIIAILALLATVLIGFSLVNYPLTSQPNLTNSQSTPN